jgi:hypothetical protein
MNDDIDFLRRLFTPHDPARDGHGAGVPQLAEIVDFTNASRGKRAEGADRSPRYLAVVASAAAVAVVVAAGAWAAARAGHSDSSTTAPGAASSCSSAATSPQPPQATASGFNHLRWQDWSAGRPVDTVDRWINAAGYGRLTETDASGHMVRDLTIVPPAAAPPRAAASDVRSTASAQASAEPTSGTDVQAVTYPGAVPTDAAALRCYLTRSGSDSATVGSGVVALLFNRTLTAPQMAGLITIADTIASEPSTPSALPDGQKVTLMPIPAAVLPAARLWLVVNPNATTVLGFCYDQNQQACRLLVLTEQTTTTS